MSNSPFGFNFPGSGDDPNAGGSGGSPGAGGFDMNSLGAMFAQFGQMLSGMGEAMASGNQSGPVNYSIAKQIAQQQSGGNPVASSTSQAIDDAVRLAELWLDGATDLPAGSTQIKAWSQRDWIDGTMDTWEQLCDPVAKRISGMWASSLPPEAQQVAGPMLGILSQVGGVAFGTQLGGALAMLSKEVLTSSDIGLPLTPNGVGALLPEAIARFGEGLEQPEREILVFLAAREAAHQRLFNHVPWLRQKVLATVEEFARGINVDLSGIEQAAADLDPMTLLSDPSKLEELLQHASVEPQTTPEQKRALERLEAMLAIIEGWVEVVVSDALGERLPSTAALSETIRRRRASGGPAEQTFANLVGLELRPRKLREASALWRGLTDAVGVAKRDHVWSHPDLMPNGDDLDNQAAFIDSVISPQTSDFDDQIAKLQQDLKDDE